MTSDVRGGLGLLCIAAMFLIASWVTVSLSDYLSGSLLAISACVAIAGLVVLATSLLGRRG